MTATADREAADLEQPGRAASTISLLYYYVVAVVGVGFVIGGLVMSLFGIRELLLPGEFESREEGISTIVHGLALILPAALMMLWHVREARRLERRPVRVFWGRALYFHLVAFVALMFVFGGAVTVLGALANLTPGSCIPFEGPGPTMCPPDEVLRNALDGAIFIVAGAPIFVWHLRQARRTVSAD